MFSVFLHNDIQKQVETIPKIQLLLAFTPGKQQTGGGTPAGSVLYPALTLATLGKLLKSSVPLWPCLEHGLITLPPIHLPGGLQVLMC